VHGRLIVAAGEAGGKHVERTQRRPAASVFAVGCPEKHDGTWPRRSLTHCLFTPRSPFRCSHLLSRRASHRLLEQDVNLSNEFSLAA
jgi:hypothetical protein